MIARAFRDKWSLMMFFKFSNTMMAQPMKTLDLHYPMIQFLIITIIIWQGKSERYDWFFLGRGFTIRTVSTETVQVVYFFFFFRFQKPANLIKLLKENM